MVDAGLLNDLDVLGVGIGWMVVVAREAACLDHKVWILGVPSGNCVLEGRLTGLTLLRVQIFNFKVWLAVHTINATRLLCPLLFVNLLVELHVFE